MQTIKADKYIGKKIRFVGFVMAKVVRGWAGLWLSVSGTKEKSVRFDNMQNRPIVGDKDWARHECILDVPSDGSKILFGMHLNGKGQLWLDGLEFEEVDWETPTTNLLSELSAYPMNLNFKDQLETHTKDETAHELSFSEASRQVLKIAEEEACSYGNNFVGTEQVLIALLIVGGGVAELLQREGVNLMNTRATAHGIITTGPAITEAVKLPTTPRATLALRLATDIAIDEACHFVYTPHLLSGILAEGTGVAMQIFRRLNVNTSRIEEHLKRYKEEASNKVHENAVVINSGNQNLSEDSTPAKEK